MKCNSDPSLYQLLIEKSQIENVTKKVKNEAKRFYQRKGHYILFSDGETQNFLKDKNFLPNTILNQAVLIHDLKVKAKT